MAASGKKLTQEEILKQHEGETLEDKIAKEMKEELNRRVRELKKKINY